jgi:metal-sulfur cluster biosynthetic enzyme
MYMKKFIYLLATVFVSILSFSLVSTAVKAGTEALDQSQTTGGACLTAYSGFNRNQTFMPGFNVLTKVDVKLNNMNGGDLILIIVDEGTGQQVLQTNMRMGVGEGWESFNLVGDSLGYILDTAHQHSIWIGTGYYTESAPCWFYSSAEAYGNGNRRDGAIDIAGDMTFKTYGYDIEMGRENPEPPVEEPEVPEEPATEPVTEPVEEETGDMNQPGVSVIPDEAKEVEDVEVAEESEEISDPELSSVIVDSSIVEVVDGEVMVEEDESVKVTGTADPGDTVSVFINDSAYSAVADEDGNWYVVFIISDLEKGEYIVEAQASSEDLGSKKVSLFTLVKGVQEEVVVVVINDDVEQGLWYRLTQGDLTWVSISTGLLLIGTIILFVVFSKRNKEKGQKKSSNAKPKEKEISKKEV